MSTGRQRCGASNQIFQEVASEGGSWSYSIWSDKQMNRGESSHLDKPVQNCVGQPYCCYLLLHSQSDVQTGFDIVVLLLSLLKLICCMSSNDYDSQNLNHIHRQRAQILKHQNNLCILRYIHHYSVLCNLYQLQYSFRMNVLQGQPNKRCISIIKTEGN